MPDKSKLTPEQAAACEAFSGCVTRTKGGTPMSAQTMKSLFNTAYQNPSTLAPTRERAKAEISQRTGKSVQELDLIHKPA